MTKNQIFPHPEKIAFAAEVEKYWGGPCRVRTDYQPLQKVMVHRPGGELLAIDDIRYWLWEGPPPKKEDLPFYQQEHDNFTDTLRGEGVEVLYLEKVPLDQAKIYFMRDPFITIDGGVIVSRMAMPFRKGEEKFVSQRLSELNIPILHTIHGTGYFEGGNFLFIDEETVVIGISMRTNQEGAKQVTSVLTRLGYTEVRLVPIPGYLEVFPMGWDHLDVLFNVIDKKLAVIYPGEVPYDFIQYLQEREFYLIELPQEEVDSMGGNLLVLRPGKVVAPAGNPQIAKKLRAEGIDVIEVEMFYLLQGAGGPRCMTMPLLRREKRFQ